MADLPKLMDAAARWQQDFHEPRPLAANSRLAIITCMDSRYKQYLQRSWPVKNCMDLHVLSALLTA